jgi:K+-sensing histidine kinase KdpD
MTFDDARRLRALADYRVLDTAAEVPFDNIVRLTARIFGTPIALVSLVDEHRLWFKAQHGLELSETPRKQSFCAHAIRTGATLLVPDTRLDPRFVENALVVGEPHVRFYCGVPLRTPEDEGLGTLCILDREPRVLSAHQLSVLEGLAHQVELELEIRRRLALLEEQLGVELGRGKTNELLANMIVHDMRGPLTAITVLATSIKTADEDSAWSLQALLSESDRLRRMLIDILDVCLHEVGGLRLRSRSFVISTLALDVAQRANRLSAAVGARVEVLAPETPILVNADPEIVVRLLDNLVGNAIKHCPRAALVSISLRAGEAGRVFVEVMDCGDVIPAAEHAKIFEPLTQGTTSDRRGYGLGLAFCRLAVDAHGGRIGVRPNPNGIGNTFFFDLPAASA